VALEIQTHAGASDALDRVAESADPRHAFLRRAWFEGTDEALTTLVALRADGRPVAALPIHPIKPGLRAVPGSYWPFRSFPIAADASDEEIAAFLSAPAARRALGQIWRLGPVMTDDPTLDRLMKVARPSGWHVLQRRAGTSYSLDIAEERTSGPWPRSSTLKNIAKHDKRLARLGAVGWRHVSGDGWTKAAFDDLAEIERNSWVGSRSGSHPKFLDPTRRRGWETAAQDPILASMMTVGILSIDGKPVSFSFGINAGPARYSIATSYDERFAKHSPGYVTGYRTYIEAAEGGMEMLNLGVGDGGAKSSMGAMAAPEMVDCLFVRNAFVAALLSPIWKRSGNRR
jgi:CelD/BcsL family acetyltransferase involved in cellulose biosynthesis